MRNVVIVSSLILLISLVPVSNENLANTPWIPPTPGFSTIHSQNGSVYAMNDSMPLIIKGTNGISVQSSNHTHTINIIGNGTGARGATGVTGPTGGNFTCNTASNCVNLNSVQTISGIKDFINGFDIEDYNIMELNFGLEIQAKPSSHRTTTLDFVPQIGTNTTDLNLWSDSSPLTGNNFLNVGTSLNGNSQITNNQGSTSNGTLTIENDASVTTSKFTLSGNDNSIDFNNATLHNVHLPSLNFDAINKYYFDHNLGKTGNLTQNKCTDLQVLSYQSSNETWICKSRITGLITMQSGSQTVGGTLNYITAFTTNTVQTASEWVAPVTGKFTIITLTMPAGGGVGHTMTLTLRDVTAGTTLSCTTASNGATCSTAGTLSVTVNDLMDIEAQGNSGFVSQRIYAGAAFIGS